MWITSSGINNSSRVKTTWQKMIKTNTEKLQICLNSSQLEGKGWVKTTHNPSFHKNSKLVSRLCIQSNLTKQMPIKVSKPGLQVYFLWKLLWHYPKLNNSIGGRKFLWLGYCNLSKAGVATWIWIWNEGMQMFIILSCHSQSQILVLGAKHHWIHYIIMVMMVILWRLLIRV